MALNEYSLSINNFLEPDVQEGPKAVCRLLVQLLLLEPGTFESHPDMGIGIVSKYRYSFKGHSSELENEFQNQINKYLPALIGTIIKVNEIGNVYYITAQFQKNVYGITFNDEFKVETQYQTLSDVMGG